MLSHMRSTFLVTLATLILIGAGCSAAAPAPSSNAATSAAPYARKDAAATERVDLHGKGLTKVPAEIFARTDIRELDLSDNALKDSLPSELGRLTGLEVLDVSGNAMTGLPAEVGRLSNLRILDVSDNRLTGLPLEIGDLRNLQVLDVRGNRYSEKDLNDIISRLPPTAEVRR